MALSDIINGIGSFFSKPGGGINWGNILTISGGIASALHNNSQQKVGYEGGIPTYTATRAQLPVSNVGRRPGSGGRRYFSDMQYTKGPAPAVPQTSQSPNNQNYLAQLIAAINAQNKPATTTGPAPPAGIATVPAPASTASLPKPQPATLNVGLGSSAAGIPLAPATTPTTPPPPTASATPSPAISPPPVEDSPYVPGASQLDLSETNKGYANPYEPKRYDFGDTREEALALATEAMKDKNIDAGEASNLFTAAWHGGVSPSEMAGALGIPESQVVNWLYNNLQQDGTHQYLKKYGYAQGGIAGVPRYLSGKTDGMADELEASIDGNEPAALSHGEFVVPADVISALGNGNSEAGAEQLYAMMDRVRQSAHGTKKQMNKVNPKQVLPV